MASSIIGIPMEHQLPAGALGPEPVTLDIRAYLVPHESGLVLVDTGMDPTGRAIDAALSDAAANWRDVSHIVLTHGHPDHTGGLDHARASARRARVLANPLEGIEDAEPLTDGDVVASLRALATPGHTPGHTSLIDEDREVLLVGDCLGVIGGDLARAPAQFTSDAARAEQSLHRLLDLRGYRMLFAHGPELSQPWRALDALLAKM